jgi:hypothetical protein
MALAPLSIPPDPQSNPRGFYRWLLTELYPRLGQASAVAELSITGNAATADAADSAVTATTAVTAVTADSALGLDAGYTTPIAQGGTGATTAPAAAANLGVLTTQAVRTQAAVLNSPGSAAPADSADTVVTWDDPLPDATYTVTATFIDDGNGGFISVIDQTATTVTIRLTNSEALQASGSVSLFAVDV